MAHPLLPELDSINTNMWSITQDARRYRLLKARYVAADFGVPDGASGRERAALVFEWNSQAKVSADFDDTVDSLES